MSSAANVLIHESQFPENVRNDLLESLRLRQVNHKFHYDSIKQTQKWLAVHKAYAPFRKDPDCQAVYDQAFAAVAEQIEAPRIHVVGIGCGSGQKDTHLLDLLKVRQRQVSYTPCDVSSAMVLVARQTALLVIPERACSPLVCDLATTPDLVDLVDRLAPPDSARLVTFFGMIPNFEPEQILPRLAGILGPDDTLLLSANLAPGPDYAAGMQRIRPQYANSLTRDWLMAFLLDLGVENTDGDLRFSIEDGGEGGKFKRVVARFHFERNRRLELDSEVFEFHAGESFRLFFSYRYTPALVTTLLEQHGLKVRDQWVTRSEEEGVFLVARS